MTSTTPRAEQSISPATIAWEYQMVSVAPSQAEERLTGLAVFGWTLHDDVPPILERRTAVFSLRRDHAIVNRAALETLQAEYLDAVSKIAQSKRSPERMARRVAIIAGLVGLAYLGGAVFAYVQGGGVTCYVLAAVALAHCALPVPLRKVVLTKRTAAVASRLAEQQQAAQDVLDAARTLRDGQADSRSIRR